MRNAFIVIASVLGVEALSMQTQFYVKEKQLSTGALSVFRDHHCEKLSRPRSSEQQSLEWVRLMRDSGNENAFLQLRFHHEYFVLYIAYVYMQNLDDCDDVAQIVWMKLWASKMSSFNPEKGSFGAWLRVVSENAAIDLYRRKKTRLRYELQQNGEEELDIGSKPRFLSDCNCVLDSPDVLVNREYLYQEIKKAFDEILSKLNSVQGNIVRLSLIEGMSPSAVAKELNINSDYVYQVVFKVLKKLKKSLQLRLSD